MQSQITKVTLWNDFQDLLRQADRTMEYADLAGFRVAQSHKAMDKVLHTDEEVILNPYVELEDMLSLVLNVVRAQKSHEHRYNDQGFCFDCGKDGNA